ncbi:DsbA family oxidoreductase [Corynebacterium choanae]|uniref:DSBA-like thioredoxin domain protein n=1 Tax=Corynebacterium choanae TaxID=1862358 RepID=A0A3G6J923_9CORY|nr:DsbA family oxidoreductase [Corynebacterium choanae]AZA14625.1 DSBA-like thioredoxin domain protein [Corynebacterium choanae]
MITIDIFSDIVCPFCYLGKQRLQHVIDQLDLADEVQITMRSFELDQQAHDYDGTPIEALLAKKYSIPLEQARSINRSIADQGAQLGLHYDFAAMKHTNTLRAHQLAHYAAEHGLGNALMEALFQAYFSEGLLISDPAVLVDVAVKVGLDRAGAQAAIADDAPYVAAVRQDEAVAAQLGITSVPTFIFNNRFAVSGAQPEEVFYAAFAQLRGENSEVAAGSSSQSPSSQDDSAGGDVAADAEGDFTDGCCAADGCCRQ